MRMLKWVGLALLALVVLAAVALAVIAWRFDPAWAKQKLTQTVHDQKQRDLRIDGDLALSFYPSVGVKLGKATLSERNSAQEFAGIENARVSVRVLPLLQRQFVVDRVELDGVRAHIVRKKDGTFNFDDLLSSEKPGDKAPTTAEGTPVVFDVAGVGITRSAVRFEDQKAGRTIQLSDVNLKTGRLAQAATGALALAFRAASEQPKLAAVFNLGGNYRYDLARKQYAVDKLDLKVKGDLLGFKQLDVAASAREAGLGDAAHGVQVEALALTATGQLAQDALDAKIDVPHIAMVGDRVSVGKLDARWSLKQGPLATQGHIAGAAEANLEKQIVDLPKLTGELQVAHPQLPMKQLRLPLDASVHADWGKSQAVASLSTRIEDSAVQGKFEVAQFSPLASSFDVAIDRLDIDRYLPQASPAKPAAAPATPGPASQPAPIDFSFLRSLDLKGGMRIGSLQARNLKFNNVVAKLVASKGRLDVNPLSASLYGGSLAGSLSAQADGNRVALKQTMTNVAIGPLMKDYAQKDILEGRGQVVLDVSAAGNTVMAARQSLNGSASMSLRDGAVKGINLAKSLRQAKAMISGGKQDAVTAADKAEKTDFSELSASFKITNGVAHNDDLSAKSPFLRAGGAGNIDLVREQIDYVAKVTIVNSTKGQEGKDLADLNGLTVPVRLTGPLDNPTYRVEYGALATDLAKQQVQKQLGQQLDKQLGKKGLGDALKGLLR